jgi:hypothetical protein
MKRANKAVSEMVGTILLLAMSVSFFSIVYISILTIYPLSSSPSVNLICSVEDNNFTLEHRGGKTLDLNTKFIIKIDSSINNFTAGDYLSIESKDDGVWNIGERVVYPVGDITNKKVSLSVVDIESNSVIMMLGFQG